MKILDGGLATELESRGHDLDDDLWSAKLLRDQPDEIVAAHQAFINAGAEVITSGSYQATLPGFRKAGMTSTEAENLLRLSIRLAKQARG
ncbi:MAG: homocysteine S-methyltransferase, partial [Planctomycetaceae bacterium]|nr:homocysteine S-methyltransferase [Planctomycetaceae bacterium]